MSSADLSICRKMEYYGSMMDKYEHNQMNTDIKECTRGNMRSFLKSARTGLCVVLCTLIVAFVVLPLTLGGAYGAAPAAEAMNYVDMHAPSPTPVPTPVPTPEPTATPEIITAEKIPQVTEELPVVSEQPVATVVGMSYRRGDENAEINLIQARLMELEYMDFDETTSLFGPATESAISRFQSVYELKETEYVRKKQEILGTSAGC